MSRIQQHHQQQPPRDSANSNPQPTTTTTTTANGHSNAVPSSPAAAGPNPTSSNLSSSKPAGGGSSSGRKLFSRFRLPFKSISRTLTDFHIMPKEPYKVHTSGDVIEGWVVLVIEKPIRITHLTVALHGYVRVFKTTAAVRETVAPPLGQLDSPRNHGNGYASLFQDEQVLSGEGKLDRGRYRFGFRLLFPNRTLPSSIDFERGTICYDIVATLTRPTTIGPTVQCNRPVLLIEKIDIGLVKTPKMKSVVLEPISKSRRKTRRRMGTGIDKTPIEKISAAGHDQNTPENEANPVASSPADTEDAESAHQSAIGDGVLYARGSEQGDVLSEASVETGTASTGTGTGTGTAISYRLGDASGPSNAGSGTPTNSHISIKTANVEKNTIRADLELTKGGFLPGDTITIRISVQHIRRMKSMHGIIVTLFRHTRIDMSPPDALFDPRLTKEELKKLTNDETFPKSRAGIAGLSLSSTTSLSVFRKDLRQNVLPLIINPATLEYSVPVAVRVPEDAFPTISNVPGEMVSFKYYLEVVLDLGGRLSNQFQSGATSSALLAMPRAPPSTDTSLQAAQGNLMTAPVDTSELKREKGVIADWFEVVIGTTDGARDAKRVKAAQDQADAEAQLQSDPQAHQSSQHTLSLTGQDDIIAGWKYDSKRPMPPPRFNDPLLPPNHPSNLPPPPPPPLPPPAIAPTNGMAPHYVPNPHIFDDSALTEKERIRRHEQILLPSHAPTHDENGSGAGPSRAMSPSAPPDDDDIYGLHSALSEHAAASSSRGEPSAPTLDDLDTLHDPSPHHAQATRLPLHTQPLYVPPLPQTLHPPFPRPLAHHSRMPPPTHTNAPPLAIEDKQELERLRLLNEASRPPELPEDYDTGEGSSSTTVLFHASAPDTIEPSAPLLDDEGIFGHIHISSMGAGPLEYSQRHMRASSNHDQLPAYER
ncbi:pH-response regulator protein palF/RIM8 [Ceratocystis fimbriata CBS 114723]|uniref:pH-response regulator protein palF/RIM8 n=1 Tax=Ceratocystis fimbriata CBS 114723 TaxID=1035309 RepID=A0A2C5X5V2_9PEZI|nr:pH-response regulator protein palF/RIM8 [Ceratocystis fimbriata CBS 114723]